jgi:CheY-like chemotaxis protein
VATRVLVVDDEEDTLNLLKMILEISGYEPVTTLNSVEAISIAETSKPNVALLDIMMPKLNGFTLCKMMRENPNTRSLPVIFVTAYNALDLEERRVEAGADLVLAKPIDMDSLVQTIEKAVKLMPEQVAKPVVVVEEQPITVAIERPQEPAKQVPMPPTIPTVPVLEVKPAEVKPETKSEPTPDTKPQP